MTVTWQLQDCIYDDLIPLWLLQDSEKEIAELLSLLGEERRKAEQMATAMGDLKAGHAQAEQVHTTLSWQRCLLYIRKLPLRALLAYTPNQVS